MQALEPQVFDLLVYLLKNRKRVVAKDELVQSVWGGRIVSDATINSRINAARRALHDKGKQQSIIRTFPKRGVRFVADAVEEPTQKFVQTCRGRQFMGIDRRRKLNHG